MRPHLHKSELKDRTLWWDGDSTFSVNAIIDMIAAQGIDISNIYVDEMTDDLSSYNSLVSKKDRIEVKEEVRPLDFTWMIPDEYKELNVRQYLFVKFSDEIKRLGYDVLDLEEMPEEIKIRASRISKEMKLFEKLQLIDFIRILIYIINRLKAQDVVWGIGRGSSVSSYVLYLIGVHDIDSVKFDLDVNEFLHTTDKKRK